MAMNRRRGVSIIEVMVYGVLLGVVAYLVGMLYSVLNRAQVATQSAYAVTQEVDGTIEWLRRDLEETALATVQVWRPTLGTIEVKPGPCVGMISSRTPDATKSTSAPPGQLVVSEYGVPRWSKHVYWCLVPDDDAEKRTGSLVRWEKELTGPEKASRFPALAGIPVPLGPPGSHRVMLRNVVVPGADFPDVPNFRPDPLGGFDVRFVQREGGTGSDSLNVQNPQANRDKPWWNTRLIAVQLSTVETLSSAHNHCTVRFKVCPHH